MSEDTQENASPATQQQPQAIDQHVHNSSTQNPSVRDAPSSRGRQPIVLCAKATKSLQKHASVLQHAQPSTHRLLFRPLIPAISVAPAPWPLTQDDPIPDDPLELVPLEIPEDATTSQEQQLFTNAVLLLQRMTPRRLTSEQPVPTGVGCHARCVPVQASVPRCYRVTCEDGMAVARLLLPIWSAALCSLVGCPPAELVVVPLYEHTLLVSACSNPAAMAAMAAAALAAQEDDEGGVLLPEGVVIKEVPTPASQRWMQWASYAGNASDIGFLTMDNVTQFPFPTDQEDLQALQKLLKDKKGIPVVRVNQYNPLRHKDTRGGGNTRDNTQQQTQTQQRSWRQLLWADKRLLIAVFGACLMVVSRILAYWLLPQGAAKTLYA